MSMQPILYTNIITENGGFRKSAITTWKPRSEIEGLYPARINHIPLHSVGIGEDSSPSGSPVLFNIGDILAKDTRC